MIPYGRQNITEDDINCVVEVLKSDWLTQGPIVPRFEEAVSKRVEARFAVAVNSATSALHIACLALDLGPGDWLWTSPNTFVASANCGLYCGANIDFVDIDPKTYNMCVEALEEKLMQAELDGILPKVVIPVHFAGQSCEMSSIYELSKRYGFKIIEDASHAIGGSYKGRPIGCCEYSDITVFSFHPVKVITTGEGGMAVTKNANFADKMMRLRSHGITRDTNKMYFTEPGGWHYEQIELGFNYRMTDIQAALGLNQLNRLDDFVERRRYLSKRYHEKLMNSPITLPVHHLLEASSWHLYVIQVEFRNEVFKKLREAEIGVNVHYIPVYLHPYYRKIGFNIESYINSNDYYANAITLPLYFDLKEDEQDIVINQLQAAVIE